MATTIEKLDSVINTLTKTERISVAAVVSRDGLLMTPTTKTDHAQAFAAMAATMFIAAETVTTEVGGWEPNRVVVESDDFNLITIAANSKSLLVAVTKANPNLGVVLHDMNKSAEKVKDALS